MQFNVRFDTRFSRLRLSASHLMKLMPCWKIEYAYATHLTWAARLYVCYVITARSHVASMPEHTNEINVSAEIWTENKSSVCKTISSIRRAVLRLRANRAYGVDDHYARAKNTCSAARTTTNTHTIPDSWKNIRNWKSNGAKNEVPLSCVCARDSLIHTKHFHRHLDVRQHSTRARTAHI